MHTHTYLDIHTYTHARTHTYLFSVYGFNKCMLAVNFVTITYHTHTHTHTHIIHTPHTYSVCMDSTRVCLQSIWSQSSILGVLSYLLWKLPSRLTIISTVESDMDVTYAVWCVNAHKFSEKRHSNVFQEITHINDNM